MLSVTNTNKLVTVFSFLLTFLFVYTAVSKLMELHKFTVIISHSPLIGFAANILSWLVPATELLVSLLLFVPSFKVWGFGSSLFLLFVFTVYLGYMLLFTPHLPCACGGVIKQMTWKQHFWFNVFFMCIAGTGLYLTKRNKDFIAINRKSRKPV